MLIGLFDQFGWCFLRLAHSKTPMADDGDDLTGGD